MIIERKDVCVTSLKTIAKAKFAALTQALSVLAVAALFAFQPMIATQALAQTAAPAPAPAAEAPAAPAPLKQAGINTSKDDNPYGLKALWEQGDAVAHTTLVIMALMSMGTWYIIVTKLLELSKIGRQGRSAAKTFFSAPSLEQGLSSLKEESPFRFVANAGLEATRKHDGLLAHIGFSDWVTMSVQRATDAVSSRLQDGLAFLATVGSTAPFVGLFGTVWGIYNALVKIGVSGQASIDKVAGPVGEALIMTAIGLAVAVPAVLGYNFIVRRNKTTMDQVRAFGSDLHAVLMGSQAAKK
jgi:biopolymer transport protein ExbB